MLLISLLFIFSLSLIYYGIRLLNKNSTYKWKYVEKIKNQDIKGCYTCERIIDDDIFKIQYFDEYGCIIMNVYVNDNVLISNKLICITMPFLVHTITIQWVIQSHFKRIAQIYKNKK
jgi:hypothetical protein